MTVRVIECACGSRFETVERIAGRLPGATEKQIRSAYVHIEPPPMRTGEHRRTGVTTGDHGSLPLALGGLGGLISSSGSGSASSPDLNHHPGLAVIQTRVRVEPPGFLAFWDAYPRKVARAAAMRSWIKINPKDDLIQVILEALAWQREIFMAREPEHRPHPATWLNQMRWQDERPPATRPPTAAASHGRLLPNLPKGEPRPKEPPIRPRAVPTGATSQGGPQPADVRAPGSATNAS